INVIGVGRFKDVFFNAEQVREIRYASLLHDFGKVGVREAVLLKAKKLYDWDLDVIRKRFGYLKALRRAEHAERKLQYLLARGREAFLAEVGLHDKAHWRELERIDTYLQAIVQANEPTVLEQNALDILNEIAGVEFSDEEGITRPLIDSGELIVLSIRRGSL